MKLNNKNLCNVITRVDASETRSCPTFNLRMVHMRSTFYFVMMGLTFWGHFGPFFSFFSTKSLDEDSAQLILPNCLSNLILSTRAMSEIERKKSRLVKKVLAIFKSIFCSFNSIFYSSVGEGSRQNGQSGAGQWRQARSLTHLGGQVFFFLEGVSVGV